MAANQPGNCQVITHGPREPSPVKRAEPSPTPNHPIIALMLVVFACAVGVALFLAAMPSTTMRAEAFFPELLLVMAVSSRTHFLSFRPLIQRIADRKKEKGHISTALRVVEPPVESAKAGESLEREVSQRRRLEEALRESQENLRLLSSSLLEAQEAERRRISIELHDGLGQALVVLKLQLRFIIREMGENQAELGEKCEQAMDSVDQIIESMRRLSRDLTPSMIEELGFTEAIKSLLEEFARHSGIKMSMRIEEIDDLFPERAWVLMYRTFQEVISNIGKHAEAENVSASISRETDKVEFVIEDDGKGFDVKEVKLRNPAGRGMGLDTLKERARMLGGLIRISSRVGMGTVITLTVPINAEEARR